jgi:hypothetical protein
MFRVLLSLILAAGVCVGIAYAQEKAPPKRKARATAEEKFKQLNKAGDGKLTLAEYTAGKRGKAAKEKAEADFKSADKDSKGYLTLEEFKTIYPQKRSHKKGEQNKAPEKTPDSSK